MMMTLLRYTSAMRTLKRPLANGGFRRSWLALAAVGLMLIGASKIWAAESQFEEGVHFERLPVPIENPDAEGIEVVEVFSYACIHCMNFDPLLESWRADQPEYVEFSRVPAVFNKSWEALAQAFYAAEALGVGQAVHEPLFRGIHEREVDFSDPAMLAALFETAAGIEPMEFASVYQSFSVRSRVQQAQARTRTYRVTGVPSLVVAGQYRVDGKMAGDNLRMLEVVDYLVARERNKGLAEPQAPQNLVVDPQ